MKTVGHGHTFQKKYDIQWSMNATWGPETPTECKSERQQSLGARDAYASKTIF